MTNVFSKSFLQRLAISPRTKISLNLRKVVLEALDRITEITKTSRTEIVESILLNYFDNYMTALEQGLRKEDKPKFKKMLKELTELMEKWGK